MLDMKRMALLILLFSAAACMARVGLIHPGDVVQITMERPRDEAILIFPIVD